MDCKIDEETYQKNIENIVSRVMETEFRYWSVRAIWSFESVYTDCINGYDIIARRRAFLLQKNLNLIYKGIIKPDAYKVNRVIYEPNYISVLVENIFDGENSINDNIYTEIKIIITCNRDFCSSEIT